MADVRTRKDIWKLSREKKWHDTILWYARAIKVLKDINDIDDYRDWDHLAAIHRTNAPRGQWPASVPDYAWDACQHGSWHFFTWHRMYLHHFEMIVSATIRAMPGGPQDWALPFWNYDRKHPDTLTIPAEFRVNEWPDDDGDNPLYEPDRGLGSNDGWPRDPGKDDPDDWSPAFGGVSKFTPEFGGVKKDWSQVLEGSGQVETAPHGEIHSSVGGQMGAFTTAPRDPLFWLHHCNIDRLWEVWRNLPSPGHRNPTEQVWLTRTFTFGGGPAPTTLSVHQVVDTTAQPLLYEYDGVPVPPQIQAGGLGLEEEEMREDLPPTRIGVSPGPLKLTGPVAAEIALRRPPMGLDDIEPTQVFVTLEDVTTQEEAARSYRVHVAIPDGASPDAYPDREAGSFSTFGVAAASRTDDQHSGNGVTFSFDVSKIARALEETGDWDPTNVRVVVTPAQADSPEADTDLEIGQVGVFQR